jgi:hypothetical protein
MDLKLLVTYCIPRECGKVCVRQTAHLVETRVNNTAATSHSTSGVSSDVGHYILTNKSRSSRDWLMQKMIKFKLHNPNNMNCVGRFSLSTSWKPLIPF